MMVKDGDVAVAGNYMAVRGVLRGVGRRVQVYVAEEDDRTVDQSLVTDVVASFDDRVLPVAARTVGLASDVDGDGRFTVLLSSWLSRLGQGRNAVDGFVRVTDLDAAFSAPFGNRCDMMYLSTSLKPGGHLRTVLAHEYMHAVVFSHKLRLAQGVLPVVIEEEGWLDEAMAHLFEDLLGFSRSNIDYRVSAFLAQPERYQLVVEDYYAADLFRSHGNRGSTYLFLRWCVDQYGRDLIATLAHSRLRGIANLEDATGCPFEELYRRWSVSLFLSGLDPKAVGARADRSVAPFQPDPTSAWPITGPRARWLTPGFQADRWQATGTSSHFVIVRGPASGGVDVQVSGPPGVELQVTAVPLPPDLGSLELAVRSEPGEARMVRLEASVQQPRGQSLAFGTLTWEPLIPPADPHAPGFRRGRLDAPDVASLLDTPTLEGPGAVLSRPIAFDHRSIDAGTLVVRLTGSDSRGRQLTGWTLLSGSDGSTASRPVATRTR